MSQHDGNFMLPVGFHCQSIRHKQFVISYIVFKTTETVKHIITSVKAVELHDNQNVKQAPFHQI